MPNAVSGRVVKTSIFSSPWPFDAERDAGALGAADPVALHRLHALGPVEVVERVEELVGVVGDAVEPLLELAPLDDVAGSFAGAVGEHLLVGEHGLAAGAPVHRCVLPVGEPRLEQPREDHLVEAHVLGVVAADLASPVVDGAEPDDARLQLGDPGLGVDAGVLAALDRGVLGGKTERVEAERREHARGPASCGSGRARRRRCSCGRGPGGRVRSGRGTCEST